MERGSPDMGQTTDNRRYAEDKPKACRYCYFWQGKGKGCELAECYYLLPQEPGTPPEADDGEISCRGCPYGKHSPCIGYCLEKILRELRVRRHAE